VKKRTLGAILLDLENILDELVVHQECQWADILNLVFGHLTVHRPDAQEEYADGSHPEFYYGPKKINKESE
jgi:hypothetical protein